MLQQTQPLVEADGLAVAVRDQRRIDVDAAEIVDEDGEFHAVRSESRLLSNVVLPAPR